MHAYNGNMEKKRMTTNDLSPIQKRAWEKAQKSGTGTDLTLEEFFGYEEPKEKPITKSKIAEPKKQVADIQLESSKSVKKTGTS